MNAPKFSKGFTLIELLVVISIIGLLSSVVLASLNTARAKGADAAIQSNLNSVKALAEFYYDDNGQSYGPALPVAGPGSEGSNPCSQSLSNVFSDNQVQRAINESIALSRSGGSMCAIGADGQSWALAVQLKTSNGFWCVSSSGQSKVATPFADNTNPAICDDGL